VEMLNKQLQTELFYMEYTKLYYF